MDNKEKIRLLLEDSLFFAKRILSECYEFYPFGQYINDINESINVSIDPSLSLSSSAAIFELKKSFLENLNKGKYIGFAVICNYKLSSPPQYEGFDAIRVDIMIDDNDISSFFYPYKIINKKVEYFKPFGIKRCSLFYE